MGKLFVIGVGIGNIDDLTVKADRIIRSSDFVYCDEKMFQKMRLYYDINKLIPNDYTKTTTRCINAINQAKESDLVSILGSGDTGIYGIAGIVLDKIDEMNVDIDVEIIPGMTSAILGSSLLGSPITKDFAVITLSDHFVNKEEFEQKIKNIVTSDLSIVFYSPSNPTKENLIKAKEILLKYRDSKTLVGITNNIGNDDQNIIITNLEEFDLSFVNSLSTIFIGNNDTHLTRTRKMVTKLY